MSEVEKKKMPDVSGLITNIGFNTKNIKVEKNFWLF